MNKKLVSIVLPTYNGSRYLSESIESCLNQTYTNLELIIVDDASTDDTPEIARRYSAEDKRVVYIRHEKNRRLPCALNTGFSLARGEYLSWTSDDNKYQPNAIEEFVRFLDSHSDVDIVYSDYTTIDENGDRISDVVVDPPERIYMGNCFGASFLFRRTVHEKLENYDEKLFLAEDFEYWLRASQYFTARPLHLNLYLYRIHQGSLTTLKKGEILRATERVYKRHFPHIIWQNHSVPAMSWIYMVWRALNINNINAARKYLCYAVACSPSFVYRKKYDLLVANHWLFEKDQVIVEKDRQIVEKDRQIAEYDGQLAEKDRQSAEQRAEYDGRLAEKDRQVAERDSAMEAIFNSWSWRITAPLRKFLGMFISM